MSSQARTAPPWSLPRHLGHGTTTRPDVWSSPSTGAWPLDGDDALALRDELVEQYAGLAGADGRVPHAAVVRVTRRLWGYWWVCRFFHLRLEDAAVAVAGEVLADYPVRDAVDITGLFCRTWQGCPEEACAS